eukprot:3087650-Rhodomonas_salina.2
MEWLQAVQQEVEPGTVRELEGDRRTPAGRISCRFGLVASFDAIRDLGWGFKHGCLDVLPGHGAAVFQILGVGGCEPFRASGCATNEPLIRMPQANLRLARAVAAVVRSSCPRPPGRSTVTVTTTAAAVTACKDSYYF